MNKKITNQILSDGKSMVSEKIWLKSVKSLQKSLTKNTEKLINKAITNIAPLIKIKQLSQKRKRSRLKEFPFIVNNHSRSLLALKSLINKTGNKTNTQTYKKLTNELINAANNVGGSINNNKNLYEYAFMKKKYFYYRWF